MNTRNKHEREQLVQQIMAAYDRGAPQPIRESDKATVDVESLRELVKGQLDHNENLKRELYRKITEDRAWLEVYEELAFPNVDWAARRERDNREIQPGAGG
ncbi:MAG: hypothetical protein ABL888_14820, partial [Pirellulaceae bacterium]